MIAADLLIEVGLPAVSLALWAGAYAGSRLLTRPAGVTPDPATMEFPGAQPPAVVSLLANGWQLTVDAAESTLLDLAARRYVELRQAGPDPRHTTVHLTGRDPADLNPYERQIFDRVAERALDGVVPLTALGFADAKRAASWSGRLNKAVIADARRLGLSRRRFSPAIVTGLSVLAAVVALGCTVGAAHYTHRDDGDYGALPGVFLIVTGLLSAIAGKAGGERDTPAGRAAAARWLGLRAWLHGHESFADLPPAAVTVWDRYLPYGAALGVTRVASKVIDLGLADRKKIWSSYTGGWRQVSVTYPGALPRYGQRLGWIVFRAAIAALLGWTFADPRELWHRLADTNPVTIVFTLAGLALLGYATYLMVRVLLDFAAPTNVSGEALWHQVWQTREVGSEDSRRTIPRTFYLVVDDGRTDRTRAWILPAEISDRCRVGDVITIRVRPWTRRVLEVTVQVSSPQPYETGDEGWAATAGHHDASAGGSWIRPGGLLTVDEVSRALGRAVSPPHTPAPTDQMLQVAWFNGGNGHPALRIDVVRGPVIKIALAVRRITGTPLPGLGDEAYAGPDGVVGRLGDLVLILSLGKGAEGAPPTYLPGLLGIALSRLAADAPAPRTAEAG